MVQMTQPGICNSGWPRSLQSLPPPRLDERYVLSCNMWFSCFIILLKAKRREIIQNCKMQGFFLRIASSRYKVHVINQISQLEKVERYQPCNAKVKKSCAYELLFKRWFLGSIMLLKGKRTSCYYVLSF